MSAKLDIREQGREEAEELEIPVVRNLVSRASTPAPAVPAVAAESVTAVGPQAVAEAVRPRSAKKPVDKLANMGADFEEYEPLNVRLHKWVHRALNERILEMKKTRKIKKEEIVEEAIIQLLDLVPPE